MQLSFNLGLIIIINTMAKYCNICGRTYRTKASLVRHIKMKQGRCLPRGAGNTMAAKRFHCNKCTKSFGRSYNLRRHMETAHREDGLLVFNCGLCPYYAHNRQAIEAHRSSRHRNRTKFILRQSAHQSALEQYRLYLPKRYTTNFAACIDHCIAKTYNLVKHLLPLKRSLKVSVTLSLRFRQPALQQHRDADGDDDDDNTAAEPLGAEDSDVMTHNIRPFARKMMFGNPSSNRKQLVSMFEEVSNRFNDFNRRGSGWILADCLYLDVDVGQCRALQGSCSLHLVEKKQRGPLKVVEGTSDHLLRDDYDDDHEFGHRCFYHAVAGFFLYQTKIRRGDAEPTKHSPQELEEYVASNINTTVPSPVTVSSIDRFEKDNAHLDLAVNVLYGDDGQDLFPCRPSPNLGASNQINLMLFHRQLSMFDERGRLDPYVQLELNDFGDDASNPAQDHVPSVMHYALIEDLGRLLSKKYRGTGRGSWSCTKPGHFCYNCFQSFQRPESLTSHASWCHSEAGQLYCIPEPGSEVKFERRGKTFEHGFVFFFDFETLQVSITQEIMTRIKKTRKRMGFFQKSWVSSMGLI